MWVWGAVNALMIMWVIYCNGRQWRAGWALGFAAQCWLILFGLIGGGPWTFVFSAGPALMFAYNWWMHPRRAQRFGYASGGPVSDGIEVPADGKECTVHVRGLSAEEAIANLEKNTRGWGWFIGRTHETDEHHAPPGPSVAEFLGSQPGPFRFVDDPVHPHTRDDNDKREAAYDWWKRHRYGNPYGNLYGGWRQAAQAYWPVDKEPVQPLKDSEGRWVIPTAGFWKITADWPPKPVTEQQPGMSTDILPSTGALSGGTVADHKPVDDETPVTLTPVRCLFCPGGAEVPRTELIAHLISHHPEAYDGTPFETWPTEDTTEDDKP